jgi:hypothetical protein
MPTPPVAVNLFKKEKSLTDWIKHMRPIGWNSKDPMRVHVIPDNVMAVMHMDKRPTLTYME